MGGAVSKSVCMVHPSGPTVRGCPAPDAEEPPPNVHEDRRGNREAKKPKQNKPKVAVSASLCSRVVKSSQSCCRQAQVGTELTSRGMRRLLSQRHDDHVVAPSSRSRIRA